MEYRSLGRTGLQLSIVGFGTMGFGTEIDEPTAAQMFGRCRHAGVNLFDCANVYGAGRAEEWLGRLAADCRHDVVLCTKVNGPLSRDVNARGATRFHIVRAVEESLRRLRTDHVDIFFVQGFDGQTAIEDMLYTLELLVQQGKILYPSLCDVAAWQAARALGFAERHGWAPVACVQTPYSLVNRQAELETLPMATAEGLGVLCYSPLAAGLLSGKYSRQEGPTSGRLIDDPAAFQRYGSAAHLEVAYNLDRFARAMGYQPASLAIAWAASHSAVTAPIVGARTLEQLDACLSAADIAMTTELRGRISELCPISGPTEGGSEGPRSRRTPPTGT